MLMYDVCHFGDEVGKICNRTFSYFQLLSFGKGECSILCHYVTTYDRLRKVPLLTLTRDCDVQGLEPPN